MERSSLDYLLETTINKLSSSFPKLKKIGAFNIKNYSIESLPKNILGSYNFENGKIIINSSTDYNGNKYEEELFDTIIHEEAHFIEKKLKKEPFENYLFSHSVYWFGIYKMLGGNLNGFYTKSNDNRDLFVDFSILNYDINLLRSIENNYDSKIKSLTADLRKPLSELISNTLIMDFSNFKGSKEGFLQNISSLNDGSSIVVFEPGKDFEVIEKGKLAKIKINYDFKNLKSSVEYL